MSDDLPREIRSTPAEREMQQQLNDVLLRNLVAVGYDGAVSVFFSLLVRTIGAHASEKTRWSSVSQIIAGLPSAVAIEADRTDKVVAWATSPQASQRLN